MDSGNDSLETRAIRSTEKESVPSPCPQNFWDELAREFCIIMGKLETRAATRRGVQNNSGMRNSAGVGRSC